ncbi:hypothetical protein NDN08_006442 [Rhodosorus marinus]|uniref:DUF202 domain-containing protein n=1 Tax=Rhodosorus marinus TaxID=101924 RepID=A0AAV8UJ32_9RHOD|nr:hypothetical protein NDN08_006442 [Rhodosorus marinus]
MQKSSSELHTIIGNLGANIHQEAEVLLQRSGERGKTMADDEETPLIQELAEDEAGEETVSRGKPKKEKKKKSKRRKDDDIKTHMSNERTFFKWLFFGFHIGGFGTFILTFFPAGGGRVYVVLFVWLVAFFFMYYGLFRYFTRRRAMKYGAAREEDWDDPIAPALMTIALFLTVGAIIFYAVSTSQLPSKSGWRNPDKP